MNNLREHIYLAALLHDIGKFYQRADSGSVSSSRWLSDYCKDEGTFCPMHNGTYTHKHVLWTAQFIEDYDVVFKRLTKHSSDDLSDAESLINLAAGHHLSYDQLSEAGKIIKEADCLSSGMDRDSDIAFKDEIDEHSGWDAFKRKSMISILETIGKNDAELGGKMSWHHQPAKALVLDKSFFPSTDAGEPDYTTLWSNFNTDFKFIQADTYRAFSETFLNILYKYTVAIPASTINFPDVSLYDHLKTTAALSICLYDVKKSEEHPDRPFLLIGADFSGIQSYIYQIVSKYAGKNLKGRSFYLKILSDSVVRYLLKSLNLFQANVVYNSGGGFYILAPNTIQVRTALKEASLAIEHHLFDSHGISLFVAIDYVELSREALLHKNGQNLGIVWGELFDKREKKKNHKLDHLLQKEYDSFFNPILKGCTAERDIITGDELQGAESADHVGELGPLTKITADQIRLGAALRDSDLMIVAEGEIPYWNDKTHLEPASLGILYYFIKKDDLEKMKAQLRGSADKVSVVTLNGENGDCEFMNSVGKDGVNNIYALDFYGGNEMNGRNMSTFEDFCSKSESGSFKRLGVLRMDVDNLGNIFQKGITPQRSTLSRYAALSRSFDYFFSGYLNRIRNEVAPMQSSIIYSGGDDLFIVGSWDKAIDIAQRIKDDFNAFTCDNSAFSISGGISIVPVKFPIMKAAEESVIEEELAKNHCCCGKTKNSISFMGMPLNWNDEFPQVKALKEEIVIRCRHNNLPKSFISKVLQHKANAGIKNHQFSKDGIKTYWMLTYDLSRMKERNDDNQKLIENCIVEVCGKKGTLNGTPIKSDYHPLELWAFACRWAELDLRTEK